MAWEFNGRHLIYTPLSGNWADEYPIQGYTLYDNCLRLWGLQLWEGRGITDRHKITQVKEAIEANFWLSQSGGEKYHPRLYRDVSAVDESRHWVAGFTPARYYGMFDAAGNGVAMLLGLGGTDQVASITDYTETLMTELGKDLIPAFWPVIKPGDTLDIDLQQNYAYSFKNVPHHFHNGGIWPIMMGWLAVGLRCRDQEEVADKMLAGYQQMAILEGYQYYEYLDSKHFTACGKPKMCYSASGALMMSSTKDKLQGLL
jgi:hypothetical protein